MKTFNEWIENESKLREENTKYDWNIYCQYGLSVGSGIMGNMIEVIKNKTKKEIKYILASDEKYMYCIEERVWEN